MSALPSATAIQLSPAALPESRPIPARVISEGNYVVRLARTRQEIEAALRLRFEIFNLELGGGLATSFATGRDEDSFDSTSHHLILLDQSSDRVVGTYRLRTYEIAQTLAGFYSSGEFDLSTLPHHVLESSVEVGRACLARAHRNSTALLLLWKGLALYSMHYQKRYFFGCYSLTSQDPCEGGRAFELLSGEGHLHPQFRVNAHPGFKCLFYSAPDGDARTTEVELPRLFRTYLRFGAKVCGLPAIDRQFRTIDFLVLLDTDKLDRRTHAVFFSS